MFQVSRSLPFLDADTGRPRTAGARRGEERTGADTIQDSDLHYATQTHHTVVVVVVVICDATLSPARVDWRATANVKSFKHQGSRRERFDHAMEHLVIMHALLATRHRDL